MKKVKIADRSAVRHLAALETELFRDQLAVVEFAAVLQYEDGSPRQGGYTGFWTNGSAWCVRSTDKDTGATLTAEGRTLDEAFNLLALLLGADDAPWVLTPKKKGKGG